MKITVDIPDADLQSLAAFVSMPNWILKEWDDKYCEVNCNPLPTEQVRRILHQIPREELKKIDPREFAYADPRRTAWHDGPPWPLPGDSR